jgi:hypothetical protein
MVSWAQFESEAPELAAPLRAAFEGHLHHIIATLTLDGSPRVSGNEVRFAGDDVWLGMMPASRKAADLRRDPRVAIHAAPVDVTLAIGDGKFSGTAREVDAETVAWFLAQISHPGADTFDARPDAHEGDTPPPESDAFEAAAFRIDLTSATLTTVAGDVMTVRTWHPGHGVTSVDRT